MAYDENLSLVDSQGKPIQSVMLSSTTAYDGYRTAYFGGGTYFTAPTPPTARRRTAWPCVACHKLVRRLAQYADRCPRALNPGESHQLSPEDFDALWQSETGQPRLPGSDRPCQLCRRTGVSEQNVCPCGRFPGDTHQFRTPEVTYKTIDRQEYAARDARPKAAPTPPKPAEPELPDNPPISELETWSPEKIDAWVAMRRARVAEEERQRQEQATMTDDTTRRRLKRWASWIPPTLGYGTMGYLVLKMMGVL